MEKILLVLQRFSQKGAIVEIYSKVLNRKRLIPDSTRLWTSFPELIRSILQLKNEKMLVQPHDGQGTKCSEKPKLPLPFDLKQI